MRILLGAAAVSVIAFVAYFFWGEYQTMQHLRQMERAENMARCSELIASLKTYADGIGSMPEGYTSDERYKADVKACAEWQADVLRGKTNSVSPR